MEKSQNQPHEFLKLVGANIAYYRKKRKLSLEKLGLELGLNRGHIFRMEKGYNITLLTLLKVSTVLEIQPSILLDVSYELNKEEVGTLIMDKKPAKPKK